MKNEERRNESERHRPYLNTALLSLSTLPSFPPLYSSQPLFVSWKADLAMSLFVHPPLLFITIGLYPSYPVELQVARGETRESLLSLNYPSMTTVISV